MSRIRTFILAACASVLLLGTPATAQQQNGIDEFGRALNDLARVLGGLQNSLTQNPDVCNGILVRVDRNIRDADAAWTRSTEIRANAAAQRWITAYGQYGCDPRLLVQLLEVHER